MQIGAIGFQPYIYNTNQVDRASMNKVPAIPDDLSSQKTDYSGLADAEENSNPLRRGESANFAEIIQSQMQISQNNASRIMRPAETELVATEAATAGTAADSQAATTADLGAGAEDMAANMEDIAVDMADNMDDTMTEEIVANQEDPDEVATDMGAATNIDEQATGTVAAENMVEAAIGTGAAANLDEMRERVNTPTETVMGSGMATNRTAEGLENFSLSNTEDDVAAPEATEAAATPEPATPTTSSPFTAQISDMFSRFQMRRATEAYAFSMGM